MNKIGKLKLENNLILAPMLGVNCTAFRLLCKKHGAGLVTTGMVHPDGLFAGKDFLDIVKEEKPIAAQIVGKDKEGMSKAAAILEEKADIIDINLGCPDKDVLKNQAGAFLTKHPEQMTKMVSRVIGAVNCPVTAKIRIGWNDKSVNAVEVARILEDLGIDAITVHGRTRKQGYTGKADWDVIKEVKEKVNVPVIGNGDIFRPEDYKKMVEKTNVDFVMAARGAVGNPFIFENCLKYVKGEKPIEKDLKSAYELFLEFLKYYEKYSSRENFSEIRQHSMWFVKGIKKSSVLKNKISKMESLDEIKKVFLEEINKK